MLDRTLAHYGPETTDVRDLLRRTLAFRIDAVWPENDSRPAQLDTPGKPPAIAGIEDQIRALTPQNDAQRSLQSRALQILDDVQQTRWLILQEADNSIPMAFLVMLVFWLIAIFVSFGLFAPRNPTVVAILLVAALSVSGSIFLILEMDQPFEGLVQISSAPMRYALAHLGQ